ncbi:MAG: SDR family oxidoreductase [Deltaproteobacteria bacterium]|nr:SDR family oxidoreductase [Deltaproteobacteria bacterium]
MEDLSGQVIMVTGASRGIGQAVTHVLLAHGARVAACARGREGLERLKAGAGRSSEDHLFTFPCDVSRAEQAAAFVEAAVGRFGTLDGLVNNAGLYPVTNFLELGEEEWDQVLGVNLKGPFLLTQAVARVMIERKVRGRVVNVSSTASLVSRPGTAHYASSKAGLNMLTRVLAVELAPFGIRVNAVLPGLIGTEEVISRLGEREAGAEHGTKLARIPLGEAGRPGDVSDAVLYLLSASWWWMADTPWESPLMGPDPGRTRRAGYFRSREFGARALPTWPHQPEERRP